jgi:replicative DNA helicase
MLEQRSSHGTDGSVGVPTGFVDLDRMLVGLMPGDLVVIGGRPGMGKSLFGMLIGLAIARSGAPVVPFSVEMRYHEIIERLISSTAKIPGAALKTGDLSDDQWTDLMTDAGSLAELPIILDDSPRLRMSEIRARAWRVKRKEGSLGAVIVDYVQLLDGEGMRESRQSEISEITRELKILAGELGCAVIALAQLNRNLESRVDKRPQLADLKDSGSFEQDADKVFFVYRDEVYDENSPHKGIAEIIVAKHRNGPLGTIRLQFEGQFTAFRDLARDLPALPAGDPIGERPALDRPVHGRDF